MVELHGYGRAYPPERRQIVGSVFHEADREPYSRLNDAVRRLHRRGLPPAIESRSVPSCVIDVAERSGSL